MSHGLEAATTVDAFVRTALRSGLLTTADLHSTRAVLPAGQRDNPQALADQLIRIGKLSRFQAQKLLQGTALGLLLGPFEVVAPIGRGGMGAVYLSRDRRSPGRLLALKVLPPKKARREDRLRSRFLREMSMCLRFAHPHLAKATEVGVHRGVYYIAMEFIPGRSLYRLVSEQGPLQLPRAARLFAEVASALEYGHGQGLIHRDLKPSNIMITPGDHAKLLDLGLALILGEEPSPRDVVGGPGYVVGSMDYIAPEQTTDAAAVDARADVYALGCTLYFALTGRAPFPGGTSREKIFRHRQEEPLPLRQLRPDLAPPFAVLVRKMMAKDPTSRFQTAAELREALLAWQGPEPPPPPDQPEDSAYRRAVAELEAGSVSPSELLVDVLPAEIEEVGDRPGPRFYLWLCLAVAGFWAVVLVALASFLLLR